MAEDRNIIRIVQSFLVNPASKEFNKFCCTVVLSIAMLRWCPMQVFKVDEKIILAALVECWPSQATWLDSGACTKKSNRINNRGPKRDPKMGPKTGPKIEHKTGPKKPAHVKPFNCRA